MLLLVVTILTTASRYRLQIDSAGIVLMTYHFLIHSLWVYLMTLLVNLLAIYFGSSTAYAFVISAQIVCIVLLNLMDLLVKHYGGKLSYENVIIWDPIAHLVLGWHSSNMEIVNQVLTSSYMQVDLKCSLIIFLLFGMITTFVGGVIIKEYDLLVTDLETEVS